MRPSRARNLPADASTGARIENWPGGSWLGISPQENLPDAQSIPPDSQLSGPSDTTFGLHEQVRACRGPGQGYIWLLRSRVTGRGLELKSSVQVENENTNLRGWKVDDELTGA